MTHPNEQFKLCRLDDAEVAQIEREARRLVWWDLNFPIVYRYGKKLLKWIGDQL